MNTKQRILELLGESVDDIEENHLGFAIRRIEQVARLVYQLKVEEKYEPETAREQHGPPLATAVPPANSADGA